MAVIPPFLPTPEHGVRAMSRWFFTVIAGLSAVLMMPDQGSASARATARIEPPNTLLLFVAGWCAPCRAELGRLNDITVAASPFAVRIVMLDESRSSREMMRAVPVAQRWEPDLVTVSRLRDLAFGESAGLPYSIAIDEDGQRCAERRDGLDAERVREMVRRCATGLRTRRQMP